MHDRTEIFYLFNVLSLNWTYFIVHNIYKRILKHEERKSKLNLLPIRSTCNLSNKICSNHRIIILYNDQHLIILYHHFFYIFTLSIWILKSLYILNKILMDTTFYMIVLLQHVCIQNKTKILHIHNDTFFSCEEYLFYMKITSRKFVLKRNNITIMYPKSNITWII